MPLALVTPHKAVVTAKTGPDRTNTAIQINNVKDVAFDFVGKKFFVSVDTATVMNPLAPPDANPVGDNVKEYDLAAAATVTVVLAAGAWTVTVA